MEARPRRGLSWKVKLLLLLTVAAVVPVGTMAYLLLEALEESHRRTTLTSLQGLATAKAGAIDQLTENRTRDVERIAGLLAPRVAALVDADAALDEQPVPTAELPQLVDAQETQTEPPVPPTPIAEPETSPVPPARPSVPRDEALVQRRQDAQASLRRALGLMLWDQEDFEEIMVIDLDGRVMVSTYAPHEGHNAAGVEYFQGGRRATFVQPVFLSPITQRLTMVIASPIRDADARSLGVIAARLNLRGLFGLIADTTGLGESGETVVARHVGEELVFMTPTRNDPEAALGRHSRNDVGVVALAQAARGHSGSGSMRDYRAQPVLAAWRPVRALGWGLVVKIDEVEAMRPVAEVRARTAQVSLAIVAIAVLAAVLVSRELVRPLRELKDATDRISRGDFGVRLAIRSADEIGELADSFERMIAAIKFFREHARTPEEDPVEESASDLRDAG
jgi:HAMP domain-containing protein